MVKVAKVSGPSIRLIGILVGNQSVVSVYCCEEEVSADCFSAVGDNNLGAEAGATEKAADKPTRLARTIREQ